MNRMAIFLFNNKENAYQYFQFIGSIIGCVITVLGTVLTIDYQTKREKEIQRQVKIRESLDIKLSNTLIMMKDLKRVIDEFLSDVEFAYNWCVSEKEEEIPDKHFIEDNIESYKEKIKQFNENYNNLLIEINNYWIYIQGVVIDYLYLENNKESLNDEFKKSYRHINYINKTKNPRLKDVEELKKNLVLEIELIEKYSLDIDALKIEINEYYDKY